MGSAKGLEQSAAALSKTTGRKCISASADVRNPEQLAGAVQKAISEFGHIDHVICGAAGNLYAPPPFNTDKTACRQLTAYLQMVSRPLSILIY